MELEDWTRWPSREALAREQHSRPGLVLFFAGRLAILLAIALGTFSSGRFTGWRAAAVALCLLAAGALFQLFFRTSRKQRLSWALAAAALLLALSVLAYDLDAMLLANCIWCIVGVISLRRLPLAAGLPCSAVAFTSYAALSKDTLLSITATLVGLGLLGYLLRLDGEARATTARLRQQERAVLAAEAENAALAERARIAREIHDVLAHSLSAQLVHLDVARLMLDSGADREQVRERVVAARRMAQEGLVETKQALSALRGEFAPVGDYLVELTRGEGAELIVTGTPRPLSAEVGLAVRRTAQEALTNVRKHAPRSQRTVRMRYLEEEVELEIRNTGGPAGEVSAELAASGSGYGLLGMRERAELLGGSLEAGPVQDGWLVVLRLPV